MRPILLSALILSAMTAAASAEVRQVGPFKAIEARGHFRVEIDPAPVQSVEITGPDAQRIAARVNGDELVISVLDRGWFGREPELNAVVHITAPHLESVQVSRGGEVIVRDVRAGAFNADASMGGVLRVAGRCDRLETAASMGGQVDAGAMSCGQVHAAASMGGAMRVTARNAVDASASMGGAIAVSGAPAQRETHASMGGEVSFD